MTPDTDLPGPKGSFNQPVSSPVIAEPRRRRIGLDTAT